MSSGAEKRVWKVGQLADLTGLTVRTLHHDDHIDLVRPSRRSAAGHRLYEDGDVRRLYQVLALRQLGLSLDAVASVVRGATSVSEVLAADLDRRLPRADQEGGRDGRDRRAVLQPGPAGRPGRAPGTAG